MIFKNSIAVRSRRIFMQNIFLITVNNTGKFQLKRFICYKILHQQSLFSFLLQKWFLDTDTLLIAQSQIYMLVSRCSICYIDLFCFALFLMDNLCTVYQGSKILNYFFQHRIFYYIVPKKRKCGLGMLKIDNFCYRL